MTEPIPTADLEARAEPAPLPPSLPSRRPKPKIDPLVVAFAALAAALAWNWYDTRTELRNLREEVARRLADAATEARAGLMVAKEAQDATRDTAAKLGAVEARVLESQSQQLALESLYLEVSRGRDEWVVADIEQMLTLASQQLQLAGNLPAALVALQTADARLARSDRPQFLPLRKAIGRDIDRLKAAPSLDVPGMTLRIDQVVAAADTLPLLAQGRPQQAAGEGGDAPASGWWTRTGIAAWNEVKQLIRVQRLDAQDQSLLAPEQAFFLRENLKLRLLHARIALLQRNEVAFREDIRAANAWLARYFDVREKSVATAAQTLAQLNAAAVNVDLPAIADSLGAVRAFKAPREKAGK